MRSIPNSGGHQLVSYHYRYTITFDGAPEPFVRWEYEKERGTGGRLWSRNHIQGEQNLVLRPASDDGPSVEFPMNDFHIPAGW